jgi:hypothetical protein
MLQRSSASAALKSALYRELDLWPHQGAVARFWWRDDDAHVDNDPFKRLIELTDAAGAPIVLAVSPGILNEAFVAKLNETRNARIAAHGYRHVNHSKGGQAGEYSDDRPIDVMIAEIEKSAALFASMFPSHGLSMFVPPWHRFDPRLNPYLARAGFKILSMHESAPIRALQVLAAKIPQLRMAIPRSAAKPMVENGIERSDIAINLIKVGPDHQGTANPLLIDHVIGALRLRRHGIMAADRPIGLMTHHLQHDELAWQKLSELVAAISEHPAANFIAAEEFCPAFKKTH